MPLVLSLRRNEDFFVGDEQFVVKAIHSETSFSLKRASNGATIQIDDSKSVEIMPNVFVSAGEKPESFIARCAIDAPRSTLIVRGDKRRNPPAGFKAA